jgi:hypothetical protein
MWTSRLLLLALTTLALHAQSTKAELFGLVRDPAGLALSQTKVEIQNTATGLRATAQSNTDGAFQFLALPAGTYTLTLQKDKFAPLERSGVLLHVGERAQLDLTLPLGDTNQALQVNAAPPLLQASRGTVSFAVEQQRVVSLPLDGRNFIPLLALAPGVSLPPGNLFPRINGSRPRVSEYIYDGISVLQPEPGQVAFYPIIDAIDEFRVETNSYSAEYGRSNGGVILVNQKTGSNHFNGTLFEFFRNEKLNARNLFANSGDKPRFRRNQYGFVFGGPIQQNKTFFFTDWQGTRLNTGVVRNSTVPTAAQKNGIFPTPIFDPSTPRRDPFPANTIPLARFDRTTQAALDRYPAPNLPGNANNYRRTGNDTTAADQFDGRLDHYFSPNHRVFTRYSFLRDDTKPTPPLPDGSGNLSIGVLGNTLTRADSLAFEDTWVLSPAAVNQLRFGFTRRRFDRQALPGVPILDIIGFQQLGPPASSNAQFATSVTQFLDNFSLVRGTHTLKAGADIRLENLDVLQPASPAGNFQFTNIFTAALQPNGAVLGNSGNSFASFLLGQVTRYSIDSQPQTLRPRARIAEFFLQDDWRIARRLTLNLGVRYTLNFPSTVKDNQGAVFNLNTQRLDFLGANGFPRSARDLETFNFAPRLGLAFQATSSLALRAGYSLTWIEQAGITTPFTTPLFPFIQTLTQQTPDNLSPAFVLSQGPAVQLSAPNPDSGLGQGVFAVQRDNGSGYAQQWNASLQKTFGSNWSIEAGYLGSKLTRLGVPDVNINQLRLEDLRPGLTNAQALRPYPHFQTVALYRNNTGHSTYHSLQARLEKRLSRGLLFSAAYTFSRLIDDAGAVFDSALLSGPVTNFQAADSYNKRLEKDVSTGNIPHNFSASFVYDLPKLKGWQLAGIARVQSGSPLPVTQATNLNAFAGFGIQRPNRLTDPTLDSSQHSTARWFNTAAFTQAPQFTLGNSSRNPVTGPAYRALDLMIGKTFQLREHLRLEARAEAFNLTNTPPLGNPNTSFGNPAFGSITTALDPRVFELVLKLHF